MEEIKNFFLNQTSFIENYKVDKYVVDLYFIKYNIVVETKKNLKKREEYIKKKLNCSFITFDPFHENFNVLIVIQQIYLIIHHDLNLINVLSKIKL